MADFFGKEFVVTDQHIKLLKEMNVSWWDCEFGAPAIDCKRPYGNSDVYRDIAEILDIKPDENDEFSEDQQFDMDEIHEDMQVVLQILVVNADKGIKPGTYTRANAYDTEWNLQKR
jgi:hypothetical protein